MREVKLFLIATMFGSMWISGPAAGQSISATSGASVSGPPSSAASSPRGPGAHGVAAKPVMVRMIIPGVGKGASAPVISPLNARPGKEETNAPSATRAR